MKLISQNYFKVLANAMRFFLIKIIANRRACITQTQLAGSRSEASEHIIQLPGCMRQHGCRADLGYFYAEKWTARIASHPKKQWTAAIHCRA